jgi:hypothetical protein
MTVSDALPSPGISYGNGMTFLVTNAWILCRSKNSHCEEWTILEAEMMSFSHGLHYGIEPLSNSYKDFEFWWD